MPTNPTLTAKRLREVLDYDPETGQFHWKIRAAPWIRVGDVAGSLTTSGRVAIGIERRTYLGHRLAWLYTYGRWPQGGLDHRNGRPTDNRIANLRQATDGQNRQNLHRPYRSNTSGYMGVSLDRGGWRADIQVNRRRTFLGYFPTPQAASVAYLEAKRQLHPFWEPIS